MPGEACAGGAAPHDLVGEKWMQVLHRVDLARRGRGPVHAEQREPALHLAEHINGFLAHRFGAGLAVAHRALGVAAAALARFAAAGDNETWSVPWRSVLRSDREAEGVKRRLGGLIDLRADIAARHRVALLLHDAPLAQGHHVALVEGAKAGIVERRRGAQLAGTERGWRPARRSDDVLDVCEAGGDRHRRAKAHAPDRETRQRRNPARILEYAGDVAIPARCEVDGGHVSPRTKYAPTPGIPDVGAQAEF